MAGKSVSPTAAIVHITQIIQGVFQQVMVIQSCFVDGVSAVIFYSPEIISIFSKINCCTFDAF